MLKTFEPDWTQKATYFVQAIRLQTAVALAAKQRRSQLGHLQSIPGVLSLRVQLGLGPSKLSCCCRRHPHHCAPLPCIVPPAHTNAQCSGNSAHGTSLKLSPPLSSCWPAMHFPASSFQCTLLSGCHHSPHRIDDAALPCMVSPAHIGAHVSWDSSESMPASKPLTILPGHAFDNPLVSMHCAHRHALQPSSHPHSCSNCGRLPCTVSPSAHEIG